MDEGGVGEKIRVERVLLLLRRALGEGVDDGGDFLDWRICKIGLAMSTEGEEEGFVVRK